MSDAIYPIAVDGGKLFALVSIWSACALVAVRTTSPSVLWCAVPATFAVLGYPLLYVVVAPEARSIDEAAAQAAFELSR
jgi:hypothetical protein